MPHLPFADRIEAGRLLAAELSSRILGPNAIILALARGGVPVGFSLSERLRLPLDVVIVRKLGVPWQPELAFGAVTADTYLVDDDFIRILEVPPEDIEEIAAREQVEIARREMSYRHNRQPADLRGRGVLLVDDGIATGSTMLAAVRHVRRMQPAKVTVSAPVASRSSLEKIRAEADDTVFAALPDRFFSVGEFYGDFPQVSDEEVRHLLLESRIQSARPAKEISQGSGSY